MCIRDRSETFCCGRSHIFLLKGQNFPLSWHMSFIQADFFQIFISTKRMFFESGFYTSYHYHFGTRQKLRIRNSRSHFSRIQNAVNFNSGIYLPPRFWKSPPPHLKVFRNNFSSFPTLSSSIWKIWKNHEKAIQVTKFFNLDDFSMIFSSFSNFFQNFGDAEFTEFSYSEFRHLEIQIRNFRV